MLQWYLTCDLICCLICEISSAFFFTHLILFQAKLNILKGRYRVTNADAEILGGYLARIEHGKFDEEVHKLGFFKLVDMLLFGQFLLIYFM